MLAGLAKLASVLRSRRKPVAFGSLLVQFSEMELLDDAVAVRLVGAVLEVCEKRFRTFAVVC
jgi:hypothetical protein